MDMDKIITIDLSEEEVKERTNFFAGLAKVTFVLYLFFLFFGTSLPFREKIKEVEDIGTSNIVNQIVFTLLFIMAIISLIPKFSEITALFKREKLFGIFLIWCLISIIWSDYAFVSFKRYFQYITATAVIFSILIHSEDQKDILKYFKYILLPYLIISIASVFVVPGAKDEFGMWKALAPSKNHLGQAALVNLIIWALIFYTGSLKVKFISILMLMISLALLIGSRSTTSLSTFLFVIFLSVLFYIDKLLKPIKMGRLFTLLGLFVLAGVLLSIIFFAPDLLKLVLGSAGKDTSFTGRTDLWGDVLRESQKHLLLGAGFQGFWVVESPHVLELYKTYIWLPTQAHNGYIDIINELGLVGIFIFAGVILNYFINTPKLIKPNYYKWLVISTLLVNIQESTFIRPQVITGVLFMFSYFALFADINKEKSISD